MHRTNRRTKEYEMKQVSTFQKTDERVEAVTGTGVMDARKEVQKREGRR